MTGKNPPGLPKGWVSAKLGEITHVNPNFQIPYNLEISFLPMKSVEALTGKYDSSWVRPYQDVRKGYTCFQDGDVIFAKITPCMENGKVAILNGLKNGKGCGSTEFHVLRPTPEMFNKLLFFYLVRDDFRKDAQRCMTGSAGQLRVPKRYLQEVHFPLPPLPEQRRIVAKIEELLTRLDAGVDALKKVKLQIKRYRQSVLKSAFEGKLTQDWREAHRGQIEPASVLLERIRQERRKQGKYRELPTLNTSNMPQLPEGWAWASIHQLAEPSPNAIKAGPFGSALKKEYYVPSGFKIYGQEQVISGDASYGDYYIDRTIYEKLKSCQVKPGDILISLVGTIGRVLILPESIEPGIINPRLVKVTPNKSVIVSRYFKYYVESSSVRQLLSITSHGETMDVLNLTILKQLPIPLPPILEQHHMVNEIDRLLSIADEIEATVDQTLAQSDRLRQSILKQAFEGKLVLQDPNDEPADKLLERIRAERARVQSGGNGKARSRTFKGSLK